MKSSDSATCCSLETLLSSENTVRRPDERETDRWRERQVERETSSVIKWGVKAALKHFWPLEGRKSADKWPSFTLGRVSQGYSQLLSVAQDLLLGL